MEIKTVKLNFMLNRLFIKSGYLSNRVDENSTRFILFKIFSPRFHISSCSSTLFP